jgi:hypothetical protein
MFFGGHMKLITDIASAILSRNNISAVNVREPSNVSLGQPFAEINYSLCLNIAQLDQFIPGYVDSLLDCPIAIDIGLEITQVLKSAMLLCDDLDSLELVTVRVDLHQCEESQRQFMESNFSIRKDDVRLAKMLVRASDDTISLVAFYWLEHIEGFMRYVRNALSVLLYEAYDLVTALQAVYLRRVNEQTIMRVQYRADLLEITLSGILLSSLERHLSWPGQLRSYESAVEYLRKVQMYVRHGWKQGFITCHHTHNGQSQGRSLPAYLRVQSEHAKQRSLNHLISNTIRGKNKDLGLSDF